MPVTAPIHGIIEGFYGTPWSWDERIAVARWCAERGMTHYVYAPKDDPKHRLRWRELYGPLKLVGFDRLISEGGLSVGFAISPGLDIDVDDPEDRKALRVKVDQIVDLGVGLVLLALDDIAFDPAAGPAHARLTTDLAEHLAGRARVVLVPTEYVGMERTPYLDALAEGVPAEVAIAWTGPAVVNDSITTADAERRAAALGGRAPLLWDNYPTNDALMSDRLFMGPLWGREPGLVDACAGYLANPMNQARCSMLPLASTAGWLRGEDPLGTWAAEAGELRVFAEACDGAVPQALAQSLVGAVDGPGWALAVEPVAAWLAASAACGAPGLEGEADEWLEQVHREANLGLAALRLLQAGRPYATVDASGAGRAFGPHPDRAVMEAFGVASAWPEVRRARTTVMGARCSFRPVLAQRADGAWRMARSSVEENQNAIDAIARLALATLDDVPERREPVQVLVDGEPVPVGDDGRFTVAPGTPVTTVAGTIRTTQHTPCRAPVPQP